ncbi:MAG: hypothetical protein J6V82_00810, partial [Clostridia bacterium]|nr:hypothetical protein [Clostridia bacterium]
MKIKRVLHFVLMLCLLSCMLALSACNDNKTTTTSTSSTAPHTHTFASTLSFDASGHWFSASCEHTSEKKNFAPHTFDEGTLTTVPTNEKGGTMTYVCTECGYEKEEFVQPTGNHVHSFNITVVAPTCTEFGYTAYTCSCSFTYQSDEVAPKGHRYAEVLSYDGGHHYYAATCGCDEYKEYAAHEFAHNTVLPTCEVNGYTEHTCKCGYSYVSDSVLATGHKTESFSHSEPSLLDASSCLYAVTHTGSCSVCGTVTASTETLECHSLFERIIEAATCAKDGTVGVFCANKDCRYHDSAKSTTSYADLTAHDYVKNDALSTPTLSVYVCSASDCHATLHETTGTSAEIPKEDLQNATEITFSDASLLLDEKIRETFEGKDISISAAELSGSEIANAFLQTNLTQEQVDLLNGGRVFNFTLTADTAVSALGGTATVRIPYTLAQGDDPTSLIVWHFANGELKPFEATYGEDADGNGYVTFSTTHFSYYTVTYATRG